MGTATRVVVATCIAVVGACTTESSDGSSADDRDGPGCEVLAGDAADLVVDLAEHASVAAAGIPLDDIEATHPDQVDIWSVMRDLASGSPDLSERIEEIDVAREDAGCDRGWAHAAINARAEARAAALREDVDTDNVDRQEYTAVNLLAILAANLAPPPERFEVPEGFPPEFPVYLDAELGSTEQGDEGSVTATWVIEGASFDAVSDYYSERLQEVRFGGWSVPGSSGAAGGEGGGGRLSYEVEGYGFTGTVVIEAVPPSPEVTVRATLAPDNGG